MYLNKSHPHDRERTVEIIYYSRIKDVEYGTELTVLVAALEQRARLDHGCW
jgi:hypothetical protein